MKIHGITIKLCEFFETNFEDLKAVILDIICEDILKVDNYEIDHHLKLNEDQLKILAQNLLEHYNLESIYDTITIIDKLENISF